MKSSKSSQKLWKTHALFIKNPPETRDNLKRLCYNKYIQIGKVHDKQQKDNKTVDTKYSNTAYLCNANRK